MTNEQRPTNDIIAIEGDPEANIAETLAHRVRVEYNQPPIKNIAKHPPVTGRRVR